MAYTGSVDLISGIRPKNNGDFPLVDAKDVYVTDDKRLDAALDEKAEAAQTIPKPAEEGTTGQILRIDEEGKAAWSDVGTPTEEQVGDAVDAWLDAHPEATTTVQDGTITRAKLDADLKEKTDAVPVLESVLESIVTDGGYTALTKDSDIFTTEENAMASRYGKVESTGYLLCTMTAPKDFDFYVSGPILENTRAILISIYNGEITGANYQAAQSYSRTAQGGTLPTEDSKGHVYKDQIFAVSIYTPASNPGDFIINANFEGYMLTNDVALNTRQIEQAAGEIVTDGTLNSDIALGDAQKDQVLADIVTDYQPFVLLNKESDVFTVVPDSYATTGNIIELSGYQLCYFTAPNACSIYFDAETLGKSGALFLSIYNTAIAAGNNVVCYRRSNNDLPTEENQAQVSAGQIIAISIYTPASSPADFGTYCNYEKYAVLNDEIRLNDTQIDQVLDELPSDFSGKMTNFADSKNIAWFGDSISELKSLPHITGSLLAADVYDCSIRGSTIGITYSNYDKFAFFNLVTAILAGDFTAQFDQLDAYERAQGRTFPGIRENLTTLSNLDFSTVDYVVLLQGTNDFGIQIYTVETDLSSASRDYAVNSYFCYDQQRYKVTTAITQGDAIVIGTNCELSVPKIDTMHELMDDAISRFITAYPRLKFFIISPPFRATPTEDQFGYSLADYIDVEKEVAEKYAIPFYNLLTNSRICDQNKTTYMLSDSGVYVHPNDYGDAWLAELCAKFISVN